MTNPPGPPGPPHPGPPHPPPPPPGQHPGPETTEVWLDPAPLRSWPPPRQGALGRFLAVTLALVVLAIAGIAVGGGFAERTDNRVRLQPGQTFESGPFQFSFVSATARPERDLDGGIREWEIRVHGWGRTTGEISRRPQTEWMAIANPDASLVAEASLLRVGESTVADFQPGMPMQPIVLDADLEGGFRPAGTLQLSIRDTEFVNVTNADDPEGRVLRGTRRSYRMTLPLTVLPED